MIFRLLLIVAGLLAGPVQAGTVRLAVASNMVPAAETMARAFKAETGHDVSLAHGATGRLYAQIRADAPFDIFLSADSARPDLLVRDNAARERATYALGRISLIGPPGLDSEDWAAALSGQPVAIADPALAPYGVAALEALAHGGVNVADLTLLKAENVGQVATWLATGNASYGVLASSLVPSLQARRDVAVIPFDRDAHAPIRQDAVWLSNASEDPAVAAFWGWLFSDEARAILSSAGYDLPVP